MAADDGSKKGKAPVNTGNKKKYVKKRPVPHLTELLANGSEESRGQKQTWRQLVIGPAILAVVFFLSFLLFMQVFPHIPKTQYYQLPRRRSHEQEKESPQEEPKEEKVVNLAEF
jgi:hypothetical protein